MPRGVISCLKKIAPIAVNSGAGGFCSSSQSSSVSRMNNSNNSNNSHHGVLGGVANSLGSVPNSVGATQQQQNAAPSKLLQLSRYFNNAYFFGACKDAAYLPLYCESYQIGLLRPDVKTELLRDYPDIFSQVKQGETQQDVVVINEELNSFEKRTVAIDRMFRRMRKESDFLALKGWREETYDIRTAFDQPPLFKMERAATCMLGVRQYGVDINGYVNHPEDGLCLWMSKRSITKQTWPGRMDNFVGGGLSTGFGILQTAIKEAQEEANVNEELAKTLIQCGAVTFFFESDRGLFPNTEFVFDLELPPDFEPGNNDGEVDGFELVPIKEVISRVTHPDMKTTSCPVTIDFLVRKGVINAENEPNLPELVENLHMPIHHMYKRI